MADEPSLPQEPRKLARLLSVGSEGREQAEADGPPPEAEAPALAPGTVLDDFEILEEVGRGGMGVVYKALERSLRRVVALKVLSPQISGNASLAKRFRREAVLAANLTHPNIVPVYTVDKADPARYFTMEFVQGRSLRDKVRSEGFLHPSQAVRIALQACDAIEYAHQHNILHRDIKPANILLQNHTERVRITDFGIAQDVTGRLAEKTETSGPTAGTPAFMSPEQNLGRALDRRTDVFSLGMTLYYMLTGQVAYEAKNRAELALAFRNQAAAPPSHLNPEVPPDLDRVVMKMIAVEPASRYASCQAAADGLRALETRLRGAEDAQPARGHVAATADVRVGRARRRWGRWFAAVAVVVCAVALVAAVWWGGYQLTSQQPSGPKPQVDVGAPDGEPAAPPPSLPPPLPPPPPLDARYLAEHPATFGGWSNNLTAGVGRFMADAMAIRVSDWQDEKPVIVEKPLARPLLPGADFTILLDLGATEDRPDSAGRFSVLLLTDWDRAVAQITWCDGLPAAGYGGVEFYAEGGTPIYRTDTAGLGKEYPCISGILRLGRVGSHWAAWVNDAQKGELLAQPGMETATKVRMVAERFPPTAPRTFCIRRLWVMEPRQATSQIGPG